LIPVSIGGSKLAHDDDGDGPAVVFVHEGIADRRMWQPQVGPFVEAGYRAVRYDLRGYGDSDLQPGPFSNRADLRGLIDELGLGRVRLVGGSYGARVALELAIAHPELVDALVLMGPGLRDTDWSDEIKHFGAEEDELLEAGEIDAAVELNLRTWVDGPARGPDEVDAEVRRRVGEMQRRAFDVQLAVAGDVGPDEPLDPPASERLADIECPTLIVVGELDQPDILRVADQLERGILGARKAVISGTAHVPSMEKADEFNRLVLEFLQTA
jgi:3-oxoadipate enol-lactonase